MNRVTIVRYATKAGRGDENEALSRAVFDELRVQQPAGVAYALCRAGDDFLHVFINFETDSADPVVELPSFKAFAANSAERHAAAPDAVRITTQVVESYGFERAMARV
jgi:hypothetical protein